MRLLTVITNPQREREGGRNSYILVTASTSIPLVAINVKIYYLNNLKYKSLPN